MTILKSKELQLQEKAKKEKQQQQRIELSYKNASYATERQQFVNDSVSDKYMIEALKKVKESNVSIDNNFAQFHGTALWNPVTRSNKKIEKVAVPVINNIKSRIDESIQSDANTDKPKVLTETSGVSLDTIYEQLGKKRWNGNPKTYFNKLHTQSLNENKRTHI